MVILAKVKEKVAPFNRTYEELKSAEQADTARVTKLF